MKRHVVTTCTRDCPSACGLLAVVEDGRLTAIRGNPDHPLNRGGCCAKMSAYVRRVYSPERVTSPMLRRGASWEPLGWDQALDLLAEKLRTVIAQSGPEAVLHYQGYGERTALKLLNGRFFAHLGGVTGLAGSLCSGTAYAAMSQDFGRRVSHDPADHANSRTIVLWGRNPAATQFNLARILSQARSDGATIWLVDPVANETLPLCSRHVPVKPGADLHLALGAARVVLDNGWRDEAFLHSRTVGFAAFREVVMSRSLEERAALAGVAPRDVADLARAMSQEGPCAVLLGWGMHRHTDAHLGVRAIDALQALCGNIGRPGGGVSQGFEEYGPYDQSVWGQDMHPPRRTLLLPQIGREILEADDPPVRLAVISAANPVCMAPDSGQTALALASREFVACLGHFLDDTARHAHLFLPCTTFLEQDDAVASYGHNHLGPVNRAIEPVGLCRTQFDIYQDLAGRFDFAQSYVRPLDDWLTAICRPFLDRGGFCLKDLRQGPLRDPEAPMVPWADGHFETPSGRFEFLTDTACSPPDPQDQGYPLWLLTTGSPRHLCSELTLAEHPPLPVARLHPETARNLGLAPDSPASLETALGRITVLVRLDASLRPDVCLCRRGGWIAAGHGLNRVIAARQSALGGGTPYYQARCLLRPAG